MHFWVIDSYFFRFTRFGYFATLSMTIDFVFDYFFGLLRAVALAMTESLIPRLIRRI